MGESTRSIFERVKAALTERVQPKTGRERAAVRLAARREANKAIPSPQGMSRQRARAMHRKEAKQNRITSAEADRRAMKAKKTERANG